MATARVETTRDVRIKMDADRYSSESGRCGSNSSKDSATGVIDSAYVLPLG